MESKMALYEEILKQLKSLENKKNVEGMARFGINSENTLGITIPILRKIAKEVGKNHELAQKLWASEIHEVRINLNKKTNFLLLKKIQKQNFKSAKWVANDCT